MNLIRKKAKGVPPALESMFSQLMRQTPAQEVTMTLRFFQWLVFMSKPLRLREWHHILAFMPRRRPASLGVWRRSDHYTESDEQLEKGIRLISKGLAEVTSPVPEAQVRGKHQDNVSMRARAGSLDAQYGESRVCS